MKQAQLFDFPKIETVSKIRTLGFYQPFGTLMLHGKIETRWVKVGKKPPFPEGKYLFYSTQKRCKYDKLLQSGMFFELFPELTGIWEKDKNYFKRLDRKHQKK